MALPSIMRKLFQNDGYGPLLKDEIVSRHISVQDWSNAYDYPVATVVRGSDGLLYCSVAQSGPGVAAGAQDPTADSSHVYWASPKVPTMPAGDVSKNAVNGEWVNQWFSGMVSLPSILYVNSTNGNDANDGLSEATAKKTLKGVRDLLSATDKIAPPYVYVSMAAGTYSGGDNQIWGVAGIEIQYASAGGTVIYDSGPYISNNTRVILSGTHQFSSTVSVSYGASLQLANGSHIIFKNLSGNTDAFYIYASGSVIQKGGTTSTIEFTGTTNLGNGAVLDLAYSSTFITYGTTRWVGSVTGKKYYIRFCSGARGIGGTNVIPGTIAGTNDSTSYFG